MNLFKKGVECKVCASTTLIVTGNNYKIIRSKIQKQYACMLEMRRKCPPQHPDYRQTDTHNYHQTRNETCFLKTSHLCCFCWKHSFTGFLKRRWLTHTLRSRHHQPNGLCLHLEALGPGQRFISSFPHVPGIQASFPCLPSIL